MASFTERATLEVKDKSTAQIKAINAALRGLQATARSIKNIRINVVGVAPAIRQVNQLTAALTRLKAAATAINVRVAAHGIGAVQRQISTLRNSAARPINVRVNYLGGRLPPGMPPGRPPGGAGGPGRPAGRGRTVAGTLAQGANAGLGGGYGFGVGLGSVQPAFLAVAAAAYVAAAALQKIGSETIKADRANLMLKLGATPPQQDIINKAVAQYGEETGHLLSMTKSEMKAFMVSMLGDVGGKTATERATAAAAIAPQIVDTFLPLQYALGGPNVSREQALEGLLTIVKGLNIATGDLTNSFGQLTEDGKRVFEGVALAKAMNPNLQAERIRSVLANLKTAAFTLSPEALARVLSSGGDRGVRVANELYMAMRSLSGVVDNKALNKALQSMDLLQGGKPMMTRPSKKFPGGRPIPGTIQAGTGTPVDTDLLRTDPYAWIVKHILPKAEESAKKSLTKKEIAAGEERARKVREEGGTEEEIQAAKAPLRARLQAMLDQLFPGMAATARTALAEAVFGEAQSRASLAQGKDVLGQLRDPAYAKKIFQESIAAQLAELRTTLSSRAAELGTSVADSIGLSKLLAQINQALKDPMSPGNANVLARAMKTGEQIEGSMAGRLIDAGAKLFWQAVNYFSGLIPDWLKKKDPEEGMSETQKATRRAEQQRQMQDEQDRADLATGTNFVSRLERELRARQEALKNIPEKDKKRPKALEEIEELKKYIQEQKENNEGLKRIIQEREAAETARKKAEEEKAKEKPKEGEPEKKAEAPGALDFATMLTQLQAIPSKFQEVFDTLPTKGTEGGTNFSNVAMTTINAGVSGAGVILGNAAVNTIKAGVANIQLNANVNVKGQEGGADQGNRAAVG